MSLALGWSLSWIVLLLSIISTYVVKIYFVLDEIRRKLAEKGE